MPRAPEPPATTLAPSARPGPGAACASLRLRGEDFGSRSAAARDDLRRRVAGWARVVAARLRAYGLELAVCSVDDGGGPCALFLPCGGGLQDSPAALVLGFDADGVRAGLELPAAQARFAHERLSDRARALGVCAALEALPEQFVVGVDGDDAPIQAPCCGMDELGPLLDRAAREDRPLWIGWCVPREVAVAHAALLDEQLEDALAAVARVYLLLTVDLNDGAVVLRSKRSAGRSHRIARSLADDERERSSQGPGPQESRRALTRTREDSPDLEADGKPEPDRDRAPDAAPRTARASDSRLPPRAIFRRRWLGAAGAKKDPAPPLGRGARVRVLEGAFSGKVGVVHELDGKGGARVMLGLLAVRLDVKNLTVQIEGRYRPVLSSSHRKPLPVRS
jgi:hypothetical protein